MIKIGRNDPCSCGSGKKYKKCCLLNSQPSSDELSWQRTHKSRNLLIPKILKFAADCYNGDFLQEAYEEFYDFDEKVKFNYHSNTNATFMPWFFYHWIPEYDENCSKEVLLMLEQPLAKKMLIEHSRKLDSLEIEYIKEALRAPYSFFEVIEVSSGEGYLLRDILQEISLYVVEKMGSQEFINSGDILFGKPVCIDGIFTMEATGQIAISPKHMGRIIELRNDIKEFSGKKKISRSSLLEFDDIIINVYHEFEDQFFNPVPPSFCNTDQESLLFHTITYDIKSPQEVFDKIHKLDILNTKKELLEECVWDSSDILLEVNFNWNKKVKKGMHDDIILGSISINGNTMTIEVNSKERAALIKEKILTLAAKVTTHISTIEKEIDLSAASLPPEESMKRKNELQLSQNELMQKPEVIEQLSKMMKKHWERWITEKVPALGNKSPKQAARSKDGKEALRSLITQFERDLSNKPQPGMSQDIFDNLRDKLNL